jgi:hypothetical protein
LDYWGLGKARASREQDGGFADDCSFNASEKEAWFPEPMCAKAHACLVAGIKTGTPAKPDVCPVPAIRKIRCPLSVSCSLPPPSATMVPLLREAVSLTASLKENY